MKGVQGWGIAGSPVIQGVGVGDSKFSCNTGVWGRIAGNLVIQGVGGKIAGSPVIQGVGVEDVRFSYSTGGWGGG